MIRRTIEVGGSIAELGSQYVVGLSALDCRTGKYWHTSKLPQRSRTTFSQRSPLINSKNRPYLSDNVIEYGHHRATVKLAIPRCKGVHAALHCFRHGASIELLDLGTPINVVTRLLRHSDSKTTLNNYDHSVHDSERVAFERLSKKIEQTMAQLESASEME